MNIMFSRLKPTDLVAIIALVGMIVLKFTGVNGVVDISLTSIVFAYFGKRVVYDEFVKSVPDKGKVGTVESRVRKVAGSMGVDPDLAISVARCESGLDPQAVGVNKDGSKDRGLFQWNNKWHPEVTNEIAFNIEKATEEFCKAVKQGKLGWWDSSKKCWK